MGGHIGGAVASGVVASRLTRLAGSPSITSVDVLDAIACAADELQRRADETPELSEMGTTITGIAVVGEGDIEHWLVFNVGDSRVYRYSDGALDQLTVDHSEVQELVRSGALAASHAEAYPHRHVITRSINAGSPPAVDSWLSPPVPGERLLACSDGLFGDVADDVIRTHLACDDAPQTVADALVEEALSAGGHDNISVVVIDVLTAIEGQPGAENTIDEDTSPRSALR
jgi:protein phosphatase